MSRGYGGLGARLYTSATPLTEEELEDIDDISILPIEIEVGLVESFQEFGRVYEIHTFEDANDGRAVKIKGDFDEGDFAFTLIQDLSDQGQRLLKSYAETFDQNTYPFKILFSDAPDGFDAIYFGAKVLSFRTRLGSVDQVIRAFVNFR